MQIGVNHTLKDIRPKAEERARQRQQEVQAGSNNAARPPGAGFMSERTHAKEALRVEVNTYTGENVRKIVATSATAQEDRILRVAAYCRVSTDDIDQLVSIELQKNNYITSNSVCHTDPSRCVIFIVHSRGPRVYLYVHFAG